ncbi:hypothetical protein Tco_0877080 [Tanacetum coccineum]|uniref:Uncharacterized protein n=1 Tax=Tanacetum coccineum TaxID=301880 RepID=A0ABQ5BZE2_9ASTR
MVLCFLRSADIDEEHDSSSSRTGVHVGDLLALAWSQLGFRAEVGEVRGQNQMNGSTGVSFLEEVGIYSGDTGEIVWDMEEKTSSTKSFVGWSGKTRSA